jgi:hypothetical protein
MASAELGINVGISAQLGTMDSKATEKSTDTAVNDESKTGEALFASGSYFIEKELGFLPGPLKRLTIGYDNMAHDLNLGTASNVRQGRLGTVAQLQNGVNATFTNTVEATVDGFTTLYLTANITDWLYVKAGNVSVDVTTTESMQVGGSYDNASLDGKILGLGLHKESENGMFMRFEWNSYSIDGVTLQNKGTDSKRSVTLDDVSGETARLSIGKAF